MAFRLLMAAALVVMGNGAMACGADTDCVLGDRTYRIAMPDGHDNARPVGAVIFAHGYRGSATGVMRNGSMRRAVSDMGLALIALKSKGDDWDLPNAPRKPGETGAAEFAYVDAVLADATARFGLDTSRLMATGFSAGGMMVWNLACAMPDRFAGFAPISGTFWKEPPTSCAGPAANVVHIHGDSDRTVPLAGRVIADTKQGDVMEALAMYRTFGNFGSADDMVSGDLTCQMRKNDGGAVLEYCSFPGGHSFRTEFIRFAWQRLEAAGAL